jgi:hypothetical protein
MGTLIGDPELILWRYLDAEDTQDLAMACKHAKNHAVSKIDCLVGFLSEEGSEIIIMPSEAWRLEKVEKTG